MSETKAAVATCENPECVNVNIPMDCTVTLNADNSVLVFCHPCGKQVTNVVIEED
jgi:membrane protease subunit (stomatin/prohibitin family)